MNPLKKQVKWAMINKRIKEQRILKKKGHIAAAHKVGEEINKLLNEVAVTIGNPNESTETESEGSST